MALAADEVRPRIKQENIPPELKALRQWVLWRNDPAGDGKTKKVPYRVPTGTRDNKASSTNPKTWNTFDAVLNAYYETDRFDGIGFVVTKEAGYVGFDLDGCMDELGIDIEPWAQDILDKLDSWSYITPSGRGLRVFVRAELPEAGRRKGGIEIYQSGRYFTVTGDMLQDHPAEIKERQAETLEIWRQYFGKNEVPKETPYTTPTETPALENWEIVARAQRAGNGSKFARLWNGDTSDYNGDESRADLALCCLLAFWTRKPEQIDSLFRSSGLMRDKWERQDYRERTITAALNQVLESYSPRGRQQSESPGESPNFMCTDLGNAKRLVKLHGKDLRYCHPQKKWYVWNGNRWAADDTAAIMRRAKDTVASIYAEAAEVEDEDESKMLGKHALASQSQTRLNAMVGLAESETGIPVLTEQLDENPWLLTVENGTLDLRAGVLRGHRREDLITRCVPIGYDPNAKAPLWEAFLQRIMDGNTDLIGFLQRVAGYCLTGDISEQVLFLLYGTGANGKSVFLNILLALTGPFGLSAEPDLLMARRGEAHPTGVASLWGARLAVAVETTEGRRLNESLVKWLTGGDKLTARFMRQDFFEFYPTHKLFIATNHKPAIRGTDDGIWRRVRLIPFGVTIPKIEQDPRLTDKLKNELPGILAWAVRGCMAWQQNGLQPPQEVLAATDGYRQEMDTIAQFLGDCCSKYEQAKTKATPLYQAYMTWCGANGEHVLSQNAFGRRLTELGYTREKVSGVGVWQGIKLEITDFQ